MRRALWCGRTEIQAKNGASLSNHVQDPCEQMGPRTTFLSHHAYAMPCIRREKTSSPLTLVGPLRYKNILVTVDVAGLAVTLKAFAQSYFIMRKGLRITTRATSGARTA